MYNSGIDCFKYTPYSIRSATTFKAKTNMVPVQDILKVTGWSSKRTFVRFYHKELEKGNSQRFSHAVLE